MTTAKTKTKRFTGWKFEGITHIMPEIMSNTVKKLTCATVLSFFLLIVFQ